MTAFAVLLASGLGAGLDARCLLAAPLQPQSAGTRVNLRDQGFGPPSGHGSFSQPAGSLDISNQAQLTPLGLTAVSGNQSTDPNNFQRILTYVGSTSVSASSPLRTLWIPNGVWYANGAVFSVNNGPITFMGQSTAGAIIRRPVCTTSSIPPLLSPGGTSANPTWTSAAWSGAVGRVSGNIVTVGTGQNFSSKVGNTVYNASDNFSSGVITSGGSNTFTAALSGGTNNTWASGNHYDIAVDSPPLTVQNLTLDGNWPAQFFLKGTAGSGTSGNRVVDQDNTFTGLAGASVRDKSANWGGEGNIKSVTTHSFTSTGGTWSPGDQYWISWGNEFEGLLPLFAAAGSPGRLIAKINNVKLINNRWGDGIYLQNNVNLTATNISGAALGRGLITPTECFTILSLTGLSDDGTNGLSVHYEVDPDADGYSRAKYNSRTYPNAGAPNIFTWNNCTPKSGWEQNPAGLYCVDNYNNLVVVGSQAVNFFDSDTNRTTINKSKFNCGSFNGNWHNTVVLAPGTQLIKNTTFLGTKTPNVPAKTSWEYMIASIAAGGLLPYSMTFTNDTFDVDASVTSNVGGSGFPFVAAIEVNNITQHANNTIILNGGTVSANVTHAVVNPQTLQINGTTFNNTGFLVYWNPYADSACAGFALAINTPQYGSGSTTKYLNIGPSTGSITQKNTVVPVANSEMDIATSGATWPPGIKVSGRKTIIGPASSAPTNVCAFGDDVLGSGNGDYYQDAATNPTHRYRCLKTGWVDSAAGNAFRGGAWTQAIP